MSSPTIETLLKLTATIVAGMVCGMLMARCAHAETNQAVTCTKGAVNASPRSDCTEVTYARPTAQTLVRALASNTWRTFSTVALADLIEVCATDIPLGSVSDPQGLPCKAWPGMPVRSVITGPAAPPQPQVTNTSGTLNFQIFLPWQNVGNSPLIDLAAMEIYSGAAGGTLSLLKTVTVNNKAPAQGDNLIVSLPGYGNGVYTFGTRSVNTAGTRSAMSDTVTIEVKLTTTVPTTPGKPPAPSITSVTIGS